MLNRLLRPMLAAVSWLARQAAAVAMTRGVQRFAIAIVIACLLATAVLYGRDLMLARVTRHWADQLPVASAEDVPGIIENIRAAGRPGVPFLAAAIGSPREVVARTAFDTLTDEVRRWETLSAREYSLNAAVLIDSLAAHLDAMPPTSRVDAADFASFVLERPLDETSVEQAAVLRGCDRIISAASVERRRIADFHRRKRSEANLALGGEMPRPRGETDIGSPSPERLALSRGFETPEETASPPPPAVAVSPNALYALPEAPDVAMNAVDSRPLPPIESPGTRDLSPHEIAARMPSYPETSAPTPVDDIMDVPFRRLMEQLLDENQFVANAAEIELRRRGFHESHLALARMTVDPSPDIRARAASVVFQIGDVDPLWWIEELAKDSVPGVRHAAISALAISVNPQHQQRAMRLALDDSDPRVRQLGQRLAERVDGAPRRTLR